MNLSDLARTLRTTPKDLREILPQVGFDIGQKAIKVDNKTAQKIIRDWRFLSKRLREAKEKEEKEKEKETIQAQINKEITIPDFITVNDFAKVLNLPVSKVLPELMKNGIFASINEKIDFDTASIIGSELGVEVLLDKNLDETKDDEQEDKLKQSFKAIQKKDLKPRSPVIVVMGHVDHGKTSLLDAIRQTDVIKGEAGGITQHIGAYQVHRQDKLITFIDTPGHEAFTAMRSRGAHIADIAILVVAADDGIKPQTIESAKIIQAAKIPFIVAINKIDKEGADINKVKQELSTQLNITPEDWGGKTICAPISAKNNEGIGELLDMVLLTADVEAENMKADPNAIAIGTIIESHVDKGEGPVATVLIQNGTLKVGDPLSINNHNYGKARALKNYNGEDIKKAEPSEPAKIIGLKAAPRVGDILQAAVGEKINLKRTKNNNEQTQVVQTAETDDEEMQKINIVLKTDVLGSGEAIEESLEKINLKKIKVKIIYRGLGNITEGDVLKAEGAKAIILGFHVKISPQAEELARTKNINVHQYDIIYDLINDIKTKINELIKLEFERVDSGRLKVLSIFRQEKTNQIVGGKVIDGQVEADSMIEVMRDKELISEGKMVNLQIGTENVKLVETDQECGLRYEGNPIIEEGDILVFYKMKEVESKE